MSRALQFWMAVLLAFGGVMAILTGQKTLSQRRTTVNKQQSQVSVSPKTDSNWLTEFSLTDQQRREFGTQQLRGHVHVVNFFFATCPSVCRVENAKVQAICHLYGERGVKFVSITCDPEKDTPDALDRYSQLFNAQYDQWRFLTGDLTYIRRVGAEVFEVPVDRQTHSERLLVIDRWGRIRGRFRYDVTAETEKLKQLLDVLLLEKDPPASSTDSAEPFVVDEETGLPVKKASTPEHRSTEIGGAEAQASDAGAGAVGNSPVGNSPVGNSPVGNSPVGNSP